MNSWIDLTALWQIVVVGLIAGAGLPAVFAIGLRAVAARGTAGPEPAAAGDPDARGAAAVSVPGVIAGGLCFLAVLAAIGWGIYAIYQSGHPQ